MEAFSLLKYWRASSSLPPGAPPPPSPDAPTTTIVAAVDSDADDSGDDGPFFDLEFTVPDETEDAPDTLNVSHSEEEEEEEAQVDDIDGSDDDGDGDGDGEEEGEFKFTLSPSTNDAGDPNLSPSDDLFFQGKLVEVEPSSFVINSSESEPNSKPQFTASLLKSATKFRIFMSALKKSKLNVSDKESNASDASKQTTDSQPTESQKKPPEQQQQQQKKLFTVKFKIEEVPIMSLFTRDNSSRGASANKTQKQNTEDSLSSSSSSDEKRFSKEVMQKYLKMVKPLYIKVSKRYGGKLKFSGQLNVTPRAKPSGPQPSTAADTAAQKSAPAKPVAEKVPIEGDSSETKGQQRQVNIPAGLKVVCKHLGKSRSASSAVAVAPAPAGSVSSRRRDDSLLQQQDGIQGAILHCKRSFNASREGESSQLPRSVSDPLHETSPELSRKSTEKGKDKSCP